MGRKCCVPKCTSGYNSNPNKYSLFKVPKQHLETWQRAISRVDRNITEKDNVCELHFRSEEIVRELISDCYRIPLKCPKLRDNAVPTIFPGCPGYPSNTMRTTKAKVKHKGRIKKTKFSSDSSSTSSPSDLSETNSLTFKALWGDNRFELPSRISNSWNVQYIPESTTVGFLALTSMDVIGGQVILKKKLIINEAMVTEHYIFEQNVSRLQMKIENLDHLHRILTDFHDLPVCNGNLNVSTPEEFSSSRYKYDSYVRSWRHVDCTYQSGSTESSDICKLCSNFAKTLTLYRTVDSLVYFRENALTLVDFD